jgi:hypothetical protein
MRTTLSKSLAPLVLALGMSTPAAANSVPIGPIGPPIPIHLPPICITPTLQMCLDPSYVMSNCGQQNCEPILSAEWKKEVPALTGSKASLVPLGISNGGTVVQAKQYPYDWTQHYFGGFYSSYAGSIMRNLLSGAVWGRLIPIRIAAPLINTVGNAINTTTASSSQVFVNPAGHVSVLSPPTTDPSSPWKQDGDAINSCEEWIYKRYWTMSQFEDQAIKLGNDPVAIFQAAYASGGINGITQLKDSFGDTIGDFTFPATSPKNAFFGFSPPPHPPAASGSGYDQWIQGFPVYDQTLLNKISVASAKTFWKWTWGGHQFVGDIMLLQNQSSPDDMEDKYRMQREFVDLVHHRQQVYDKYFKAYEQCTNINLGFTQFLWCPPEAHLDVETIAAGTAALLGADYAINSALKYADSKGCLDPTNVNNCDWSPSYFVDQVESIVQTQREPQFNRCLNDTSNGFGTNGIVGQANAGHIPGVAGGNWNVNSAIFNTFLYLFERAASDIPLPEDASGRKHVGVWKSDSLDAGGDWFGGHFGYNIGFQVTGLPQGVCHANFKALGTLNADVTVLKQKHTLVDFLAETYSTEPSPGQTHVHSDSHFQLLGNDVYNPINDDENANFRVVLDHTEKQADGLLPSISATFFVGPVPVSVSAGVTGGAGFEATLQGGITRDCGNPDPNKQLTLGVGGAFEPFIHVDGFASAGVGISGLAEVGIKGYLTLVQVELPLHIGMNIGLNSQGLLTLQPNAGLDLNLSVFGGRLVVFAEALFLEAEATIVQWPGYKIDGQNLFRLNFDPVPLAEVALSTVD